MAIKEENSKRVKRLEDELSEEKIEELFKAERGVARRIVVKRGPTRRAVGTSILFLFLLAVAFATLLQFYQVRVCQNNYMADTIIPRDAVILSTDVYRHENIRFGDVVIHDSWIIDPDGGWYELCVRIIGVPGDMIEITGGNVYRNGEKLDEPYIRGGKTDGEMALIVPNGNYFVLGDNRGNTIDSRDPRVGFIAEIMIKGKVTRTILPVSRFGAIN